MAFIAYKSTDTSAPVLTGETGKLIDLLQAVLIDGYGSKAGAGWTKPYNTGSAVAVFKQGAGSMSHTRIRDDGPNVTSTFKEAWARGYLLKNNVSDTPDASNTEPTPTVAQITNGAVIRKSASADSTARAWKIWADARTAILAIYTGDSAGQAALHYFGDGYDLGTIANLMYIMSCRSGENSAVVGLSALSAPGSQGMYLMKPYTGSGSAVASNTGALSALGLGASLALGSNLLPFPNAVNGAKYLSHMVCGENGAPSSSNALRGWFRGVWFPLNGQTSYADGDTLTGVGPTAGRTFELVKSNNNGFIAIETSDTVDTN